MTAAYVALSKLKGERKVLDAAKHNLREIRAELYSDSHIDSSRTKNNLILAGPSSASEIDRIARQDIPEKVRKDAVRAIEIVVSIPHQSIVNVEDFFSDTLDWVNNHFGLKVLSAVVHFDESEPHCHILILPVKKGRLVGSRAVGNAVQLRRMQTNFYETVSRKHGCVRPSASPRIPPKEKQQLCEQVLDAIASNPACLLQKNIRSSLLKAISVEITPLTSALGIEIPNRKPKRAKSFVEIMISPVKPEPKVKPIGFRYGA